MTALPPLHIGEADASFTKPISCAILRIKKSSLYTREAEITYSAYGLPLSKTCSMADTLGTLTPYRYRGYIYDEKTGVYYCQSRYYDSSVGRWLNADGLMGANSISSLGFNLYSYCDSRCTSFADYNGEKVSYLMLSVEGYCIGGEGGGIGLVWDDRGNSSVFFSNYTIYAFGSAIGGTITYGRTTHYESIYDFVANNDGIPENDGNPYFSWEIPLRDIVTVGYSEGIAQLRDDSKELYVSRGAGTFLFVRETWTDYILVGDQRRNIENMLENIVDDPNCDFTTTDLRRYIKQIYNL